MKDKRILFTGSGLHRKHLGTRAKKYLCKWCAKSKITTKSFHSKPEKQKEDESRKVIVADIAVYVNCASRDGIRYVFEISLCIDKINLMITEIIDDYCRISDDCDLRIFIDTCASNNLLFVKDQDLVEDFEWCPSHMVWQINRCSWIGKGKIKNLDEVLVCPTSRKNICSVQRLTSLGYWYWKKLRS